MWQVSGRSEITDFEEVVKLDTEYISEWNVGIVEAMGGGVFTYIVDLANELVNSYDMYIAYAVRKQTPQNYKDYFDKRIHLIEVKNFGRAIDPAKDIAAFFEVKKMAAENGGSMERTPFTTYRKEHANAANDKTQTPGRTGSAGRFSL